MSYGGRIVERFGQWLSIAGAAFTGAFQGGTTVVLQGCDEIDVPIIATFDASTTLTGMKFRIAVSDDGTTWDPVATVLASSGALGASATLTASAGATVRDRLMLSEASVDSFRNARYHRIEVQAVGTPKAGDSASSNLNYSF